MDDPRGPLSISLLIGFIFIILNPLDSLFMGIGSFLIFISITLIIFNSLPNIRKRSKILQKGAKIVGFGQLYTMVVKHYIPKFCKWWILFLIALMAILPMYVTVAPLFFESDDTLEVDVEGNWEYPSNFPGYKDSDRDGINDRNPYVPLEGFYKQLWQFRGSIPVFNYEYPLGVAVIVGFSLPQNGLFNLIEFFTAGMYYFGAVIRDPAGYAPILPILLPYLLVSGLFSTVPLVALILAFMFIFVIVVYGAAPVIAGQVVKLPFRLIDYFTFMIRISLIAVTLGGIVGGLLALFTNLPMTIATIITMILKIPLTILMTMKTIVGFGVFVATFSMGIAWFYSKNVSIVGFFTLKKAIGAAVMMLGFSLGMFGNVVGLALMLLGFSIFISKKGIGVGAFGAKKWIGVTGSVVQNIINGVVDFFFLIIDATIGSVLRAMRGLFVTDRTMAQAYKHRKILDQQEGSLFLFPWQIQRVQHRTSVEWVSSKGGISGNSLNTSNGENDWILN